MSSRGTYRRHSSLFKIQVCQEIRSGGLVRRGTQEKYNLSAYLIQHWLALYDRGELVSEEAEATVVVAYQAKIAALERKVDQLTMELDLLKKRRRRGSPATTRVRRPSVDRRSLHPSGV